MLLICVVVSPIRDSLTPPASRLNCDLFVAVLVSDGRVAVAPLSRLLAFVGVGRASLFDWLTNQKETCLADWLTNQKETCSCVPG